MKLFPSAIAFALLIATADAYSIRFLAWDHDVAEKKISLRNAGKDQEIADLHPHQRSATIAGIAADSELLLVAPGKDGKPATLRLEIPGSVTDPLVILLPDSRDSTGLRAFTVEDSTSSFQFGSTRFFNVTGKALMVRYEQSVLRLEKPWVPVDFTPAGESRNAGVQMVASADAATVLYSAIWDYDPGVRKIAFIAAGSPSDPGPLNVKIISERRRDLAVR